MKLLIPYNEETYNDSLKYTDSYLIGIKGYTVNMGYLVTEKDLNTVIEKIKKDNKQIFININKNMFNKDLEKLKKLLKDLNNKDIKLCFYDVSIIEIVREEKLNIDLVWHQEHATTNYLTINYWKEKGCKYTFLSNEITKEERPLITNYKKYFNIKDDSKIYNLEYQDKLYPIIEKEEFLESYDAKIRNAYDIKVDYNYLNDFLIEKEKFIEVLKCYKERNFKKLETLFEKYEGFLKEKTVYRVKDL